MHLGMLFAFEYCTENLMNQRAFFARSRSISMDFSNPPGWLGTVRVRPRTPLNLWRAVFGMVGLLAYSNAPAQPAAGRSDLTELPIETLLQLEVTTVSRQSAKLPESPHAVSTIH